jgi:phytoene synthase
VSSDRAGTASDRPVDPATTAAYRHCRELNARHGKTFFLATGLLPAAKRPPVHALYGFARYADDIVDHPAPGADTTRRLSDLRTELEAALDGRRARHPVVRAVVDTVHRFDLDEQHLSDFLDAMASDLTVRRYPTFEDLQRYMWGSASVIGLLLLPILGVTGDRRRAEQAASDLGVAFQLTNFIRDVGEDLARGRIYLPLESLAAHQVTEAMLGRRASSPEVRALIAAECGRARGFYRSSRAGMDDLSPDARDCVRTAWTLYGEILTEIERASYEVLDRRATVSRRRRLTVGVRGYTAALRARRG